MKLRYLLILCIVLGGSMIADAQIGRLALSPLQTIEQVIARTNITITYCRPSARGRVIFGELVKYDEYWRTGANKNTKIEIDEDFYFGGKKVDAGTYAVFTTPSIGEWEVILYAETGKYGLPDTLDQDKIVASMTVPSITTDYYLENLNIGIENFTNYDFNLAIAWEKTKIIVPFQLNTREVMEKVLADEFSGPSYNDYYAAANYEMESGYNFERGLEWINKAIEVAEPYTWWDLRIKAILLYELGEVEKSKKIAIQGLQMAKKAKRDYGINEFENLLKKLN